MTGTIVVSISLKGNDGGRIIQFNNFLTAKNASFQISV